LSCPRLHERGGGDKLRDIAFGETKGHAPADRHARRRNDNAHFIAAPGLWLPRDKPKAEARGEQGRVKFGLGRGLKFDLRILAGGLNFRIAGAVMQRQFGKGAPGPGRFFYFKHRSGSLPRASGALLNRFQPLAKSGFRVKNSSAYLQPRRAIAALPFGAKGAHADATRLGHFAFSDVAFEQSSSLRGFSVFHSSPSDLRGFARLMAVVKAMQIGIYRK
jgi:hypothetical protein